MLFSQNLFRACLLAAGIAGVLFSGRVHAAAFQLKENSAKGQGRAFAGSASAPGDVAVVANNPAAMRLLEGRQLQLGTTLIGFSAKFDGGGRYVGAGGPGTGTAVNGGDGGNAGAVAPLPAMYFYTPIGENMHVGTSVTAPFGLKTVYDRDWVGRYQGIKTELSAIDAGLAFSYDVNPYVSFGASVFAERLDIDLTNAVDFGAALHAGGAPGFGPGSADGLARVKGHATEFGFTLGGLFTIVEGTNVGFTYRSQVEHKVDNGSASFEVPGGAMAILSLVAPNQYVKTGANAKLILPASATASFTHAINDRWSVMADVTRTAWSKFDEVTIHFDSAQADNTLAFRYRDTTFVSAGADYKVSQTLTLRGGLAYDQSPTTTEHRDVRVPDAARTWVSLGLSWIPSDRLEWNLGYTHLFVPSPSVSEVIATGSSLNGTFDVSADVLASSLTYRF